MKKRLKPACMAVSACIVLFALSGCGTYNRLVTLDEGVKEAWAQIETQLQRRLDLIPNYVATVKGYAAQEKDVLVQVTEARAKVAGAGTVPEKIKANNELTPALSRLMVVVERYPDLKSNQNFLRLQDELAGTENRLKRRPFLMRRRLLKNRRRLHFKDTLLMMSHE